MGRERSLLNHLSLSSSVRFLLSAPFLSVDRMLITLARMTLATHLLSKIPSSPHSSSIYGAFMAAHFFSDKFNYARRASRFILLPSRTWFLRDERRHGDLSGGRVIAIIKRKTRRISVRSYPCNSSDMTLESLQRGILYNILLFL